MSSLSLCTERSYLGLACWLGNIAGITGFIENIPQIILNFRRKSLKGFSALSVIIRIFSTTFTIMTRVLYKPHVSILFSACLVQFENFIVIVQFLIYEKQKWCWTGFIAPLPGILISLLWPASFLFTQYVPAICLVLNFIPFYITILRAHTTMGISMIGLTIGYIAAGLGILSCSIQCTCDTISWIFYLSDVIICDIIYVTAMAFGEFRVIDSVPRTSNMKLDSE